MSSPLIHLKGEAEMLILLMLFLITSSILVLIVKRNKETFYIFGMCMSLAIMLSGILLYISKKGGISSDLQEFFFFSIQIKTRVQYTLITLDNLGYTIAIGRYLFPLFFLLLSLHYSMIPWIQRNYWIYRIAFVLPTVSLVVYYPDFFRILTTDHPGVQQFIITGTLFWITIYTFASIFLMLYEAYSIKMKFFQKQFIIISGFILSLSFLFLLYCGQDPAQVYRFYSDQFVWEKGIYYMNAILPLPTYFTIVILNIVFAIIGFSSMLKYTKEIFEASREEITLERGFNAISSGTSTFVHSIKNQLLSNRVVFKRINRVLEEETLNKEKLVENLNMLSKQNENSLMRIEELYRSVKTNFVQLVPVKIEEIIDSSIQLFHNKYPCHKVDIELRDHPTVLADRLHFSEAIYNLLVNAQEAVNESEQPEIGKVSLLCYTVRLYTVIEIKDNGIGLSKEEIKKIWVPFYSKKNTNHNWGMGLYYVKMITKEHFGSLRVESELGKGSTFYILLPKFK